MTPSLVLLAMVLATSPAPASGKDSKSQLPTLTSTVGWQVLDIGWATVKVPPQWRQTGKCLRGPPDQCSCSEQASVSWQSAEGAHFSIHIDMACGGNKNVVWKAAVVERKVHLDDAPAPDRCTYGEDGPNCDAPGWVGTSLLESDDRFVEFLFGHSKRRSTSDLSLFRTVIESVRLKLDALDAPR
jgi:hypothetical protein